MSKKSGSTSKKTHRLSNFSNSQKMKPSSRVRNTGMKAIKKKKSSKKSSYKLDKNRFVKIDRTIIKKPTSDGGDAEGDTPIIQLVKFNSPQDEPSRLGKITESEQSSSKKEEDIFAKEDPISHLGEKLWNLIRELNHFSSSYKESIKDRSSRKILSDQAHSILLQIESLIRSIEYIKTVDVDLFRIIIIPLYRLLQKIWAIRKDIERLQSRGYNKVSKFTKDDRSRLNMRASDSHGSLEKYIDDLEKIASLWKN